MSVYKKCTVALSLCRFWNFDTFLQKVKNAHYYWSFFWHFDTPDKTRNYQKDRKRQSDKSFKVSKYHVIWYFPKLGLTLVATHASPFLAAMPAHYARLRLHPRQGALTPPLRLLAPNLIRGGEAFFLCPSFLPLVSFSLLLVFFFFIACIFFS